jgi:hypothetical protein
MEKLRAWLHIHFDGRKVEPDSGLGEAIRYLLKHWDRLTLFLRQAGAPLDNNAAHAACGISGGMPTSGLCRAISPPMGSERESAALIVREAA